MDIHGDREPGPSWARDNWPLIELDEVNAGLDPTLMVPAKAGAQTGREDKSGYRPSPV